VGLVCVPTKRGWNATSPRIARWSSILKRGLGKHARHNGLHNRKGPSRPIPYSQETHLLFQGRGVSPTEGSCRFPLMVLEQITQSLLATRDSVIPARPSVRQWEQEPVLTARTIRNQPQVGVNCGHGKRKGSDLEAGASLQRFGLLDLWMGISSPTICDRRCQANRRRPRLQPFRWPGNRNRFSNDWLLGNREEAGLSSW
jgi:hypothetical protein